MIDKLLSEQERKTREVLKRLENKEQHDTLKRLLTLHEKSFRERVHDERSHNYPFPFR